MAGGLGSSFGSAFGHAFGVAAPAAAGTAAGINIHPIDPRFMAFPHWSAMTASALSAVGGVARSAEESEWRRWADEIKNIPALQSLGAPDPRASPDWQDWAGKLNDVLWSNTF